MPKLTREEADTNYDRMVGYVANQLRALANDVERVGLGTDRLVSGQVWRATEVAQTIYRWLNRGDLGVLVARAVEAEHATARATPAELLDQAATALDEVLQPENGHIGDDAGEWLADVALRGAGVIR